MPVEPEKSLGELLSEVYSKHVQDRNNAWWAWTPKMQQRYQEAAVEFVKRATKLVQEKAEK